MNGTKTIKELFGNSVFRIPNYQRGFSWGERQLNDLWEDINDIRKREDGRFVDHYTGTIFLEKMKFEDIFRPEEKWMFNEGVRFYSVVDGQQRLTSLVILIFELIKHSGFSQYSQNELARMFICASNGNLKCYKFLYETNNRAFLINKIFEDNSEILPSEYENVYTRNLSYAKAFFRKKLSSLDENGISEIYGKIFSALKFDERPIEQEFDVQAVFETMNNRGKPLTILEKLKNRLIYLCSRFDNLDEVDALKSKINEAWSKVYTNLARNPESLLDEDVFLSAFLSLYRKPNGSTFSEVQAEQKVFEMFCTNASKYNKDYSESKVVEKEEDVNYNKIFSFISSLSDFSDAWYRIHNDESDLVRRILILNGSKELKILLATLFLIKEENPNYVKQICELIELLLFRSSIPGLEEITNWDLAEYARKLYKNPISEENNILEDIKERINRPCDQQAVINRFRGLFSYTNGNKGYHRWGGLKYVLFLYENYLKTKYYEEYTDRVKWTDYTSVNIEHILPQNYPKHWQSIMGEYLKGFDYDSDYDSYRRASIILINSIGNLTIISAPKNFELQDNSWENKKKRYSSGSFSEQRISEYELWDQSTIYKRSKTII